jgi:hypothetical protein
MTSLKFEKGCLLLRLIAGQAQNAWTVAWHSSGNFVPSLLLSSLNTVSKCIAYQVRPANSGGEASVISGDNAIKFASVEQLSYLYHKL